ncbi:aldo/keto reductase [Lederbergia wuyishanensis]|uniref:Aryl-alcohol dehydrogenase-like predicted oxidoreductase n=1 Tax=Lederbergia wuyishanensis TaxID=1347903 RepID=A0ABU0D350_9BACI|nr:aldo/keto reductase [Lederbergia wuyishanensis]MCJ8008007.1 aldo/keto reductase [Lederbergia wuyishanensis]MDQ0342822.1 aryl-alcohol dehydrogenase-like predicted oxidoreductase [Lederbergia wuyishanensis]
MRSIQVKGVDKKISSLVMGSGGFTPDNMERVTDVLNHYLEIGGNTIDTAFIYYGGKSEGSIGIWMEENKRREDVNILTKGAHHNADGPRVSKEAIDEELEISLDRLRTDYVELYALHRDNPEVPVGEILEILNAHVEAGRIGAFGGSNWSIERLQEANDYAEKHGLVGFSFSSPNLSLAKPNEPYWAGCVSVDDPMLAWHEGNHMPLFSWSSQASGFFTGRFTPEDRSHNDIVRVYYNDKNWERYRRAEQLAKEKGVETVQISLAYVLNQSFPTAAIIGPQNKQEILSCKQAMDISLSEEEMKWLDLRIE